MPAYNLTNSRGVVVDIINVGTTTGDITVPGNLPIEIQGQGKTAEAVNHYNQALSIDPDEPDAHYNLGVTLETQGKIDSAVSRYLKTLELSPGYTNAHYNLGRLLAMTGRPPTISTIPPVTLMSPSLSVWNRWTSPCWISTITSLLPCRRSHYHHRLAWRHCRECVRPSPCR